MPDETREEWRLTQVEETLEHHDEEIRTVGALRKEVEMLKETVRSNTQVMYILVGLIISSGIAGALLKGLI